MIGFLKKLVNPLPAASAQDDLQAFDLVRCAALKKRGNELLAEGEMYEAGRCYRQATLANPEDASAFVNLGYALMEQKHLVEARSALEQALILDRTQHDAHFMLGTLAQQQGNMSQAIFRFREVLKLRPDFELGYRELGYELFRNGENAVAEQVIAEGIRRFPQSVDLLCNSGSLYCVLNEPRKAIASYENALALQPDSASILGNLGAAYDLLGDRAKADELMRRSLELNPGDMDIQANLGTSLWTRGRYEEAMKHFRTAVSLDSDYSAGHMNLGLASLLMGDYERGWTEYEWRFKGNHSTRLKVRKVFAKPLWLGESSLKGKTILLHCEQGLGDTLQFCRYATEVSALGATVVLQVQRGLKDLLSSLAGVTQLVEEGEPLPVFDFHCPLMSLPLALGHHKSGTIVARDAYVYADPQRAHRWQQRMADLGAKAPRVGVVWSGNPLHLRDRQRSMSLSDFLQALPDGMTAVSLQPDLRESDLPLLRADGRIKYLGSELKNFADTAALISGLDLVISVDTSVAHLAGALGKPVWVLVTHVPDWRWLLNREDSPWYPSAKIFRQETIEDWGQPLQQVRAALQQRYELMAA